MTGQTFSRDYRLLKPADYTYVFADAKRFGNPNFTLLVRANNLSYPRLGLAVAKKNKLLRPISFMRKPLESLNT